MVFQLNREQVDARIATEAGFAEWFAEKFMQEHLLEFYGEFGPAQRLDVARRARRTALHFGFDDPASQAHFAALMWRVCGNFFTFPGFREIAAQKTVDGPTRIAWFYTQVTPDQAADAILQGEDTWLFHSPLDDDEQGAT